MRVLLSFIVAYVAVVHNVRAECCPFTLIHFVPKDLTKQCQDVVSGSEYNCVNGKCTIKACGDGESTAGFFCSKGFCNHIGCECRDGCITDKNGKIDTLGNFARKYGDLISIDNYSLNDVTEFTKVVSAKKMMTGNDTKNFEIDGLARTEDQRVCFYMHFADESDRLTLTRLNLEWGKRIVSNDDFREVPPQTNVGETLTNRTIFRLCFSGRESSPSGTSGDFDFNYSTGNSPFLNSFSASFDVPYWGTPHYEVDLSGLNSQMNGTVEIDYLKKRCDITLALKPK